MSTTHTPGPWKIRAGFESDTKEIYAPNPKIKKPGIPTQLADVRAEDKEGKANARLISASPVLLKVLQELQESASYWNEYDVPLGIVDRINAAIDLATKARS